MTTMPEPEVLNVLSLDIQTVGVDVARRVATCRTRQNRTDLTRTHLNAIDLKVLVAHALDHLVRAVEPEELLDRVFHQSRGVSQTRKLVGVPQQGQCRQRDHVCSGLVPRLNHQDAQRDQFIVCDSSLLIRHLDEHGHEVVLRPSAALPNQLFEIAAKPARRLFT